MAAPSLRVLEHELLVYRRSFRGTLVSSFLNPVLYLAAMGVGLGSYVASGAGTAGAGSAGSAAAAAMLGGIGYLAYLAPGLLASTAMQTAAGESTFPIMGGILWDKTFHGMLATPVGVVDILVGKILYILARLTVVTGVFFGVMVMFGAATGPNAALALPGAILTGLAFATPIIAYSATQKDSNGFNSLFRFGIIPLFLFSGTFFPISQLPPILQAVAVVTPLWHGVDLCRSLALGYATPVGVAVHVTYLGGLAALGFVLARVALARRLSQ
jgi:lipooligosaccharide transport system permease protein